MKKICIIATYMYPIPAIKGGALEQIVEAICRINEEKKQYDITVLATYDKDLENRKSEFSNTEFVYFKSHLIDRSWFLVFRIVKKIFNVYIPAFPRMITIRKWIDRNKDKFDLFLFEDGLTYMIGYLLGKVDRKKVVSHLHWIGDPVKTTNNYIGHLLTVSEYVGEKWCEQTQCAYEKYSVVHNGININKFTKEISQDEKKMLKQSLGLENNEFTILYVGRIVKEKGVLEIIRAIGKMNNKNVALILVGSAQFAKKTATEYEKKVENEIRSTNVHVISVGFINNDNIYKYQNIADVAVIATLCEEAAGLVAIEHMAAGLPLIITRSGGLPEYVAAGAALMVERDEMLVENLAAKLDFLSVREDVCHNMRKEARIGALRYTQTQMYQELVDALDKYSNSV